MLKLRFNDSSDIFYHVEFSRVSDNIVQLVGELPKSIAGFSLYKMNGSRLGTYDEYTTIYRVLDNGYQYSNDGSIYVPPIPVPDPEPYVPTIEDVRLTKRKEINEACETMIISGVDVKLSDGSMEHFDLKDRDQLNLFGKLEQIKSGIENIEYHSDTTPTTNCKYYSNADMKLIIDSAMWHVSYHQTYCISLKVWIDACQTIDEISAIYYGIDIPEEYMGDVLSNYNMMLLNSSNQDSSIDNINIQI